jgi:hypothetical protein
MTEHTRKPASGAASGPPGPSEPQPDPADIDWDQAVTQLGAMLDRIEDE